MIIIAFILISVLGFCNYRLWCEIEKTKNYVMFLLKEYGKRIKK